MSTHHPGRPAQAAHRTKVRRGRSGDRVSPGLVALGSAAVVAVYGAGFYKTQVAADAFAEPDRSGSGPAALPPGMRAAAAANPGDASAPAAPVAPSAPAVALALPTSAPVEPVARTTGSSSITTPATPSGSPTQAAATASPVATPAEPVALAVSAPATAPATAPAATAAVSASPTTAAAPEAPAAASAEASQTPLPATQSKLKDGTYMGWGRCRHGDIEAKVEITGGKIVSAEITQCLTRWSCSWISPLPPQVLTRQSENVDYVSGATQSAIAFYWAIFDALSKAK